MKRILFPVKRIYSRKLRSQKGASVIFAIVGFMFAAMISMVVINAAYSAATRVKKLKYDEQAFLLAQSMSGIIADALSGSGNPQLNPDGTQKSSPGDTELKYDGLTISYQYVEQRDQADGNIYKFYNDALNDTSFKKSILTGISKKTFCNVEGKDSLSDAAASVQNMIYTMTKRVDQGIFLNSEETVRETISTDFPNPGTDEKYEVQTVFTMDNSYSINAVTTATVTTESGNLLSKYIVRLDANAVVRTDKFICVGKKDDSSGTITAFFEDKQADATGEELMKISCYSVTWPPEQIKNVYVAP